MVKMESLQKADLCPVYVDRDVYGRLNLELTKSQSSFDTKRNSAVKQDSESITQTGSEQVRSLKTESGFSLRRFFGFSKKKTSSQTENDPAGQVEELPTSTIGSEPGFFKKLFSRVVRERKGKGKQENPIKSFLSKIKIGGRRVSHEYMEPGIDSALRFGVGKEIQGDLKLGNEGNRDKIGTAKKTADLNEDSTGDVGKSGGDASSDATDERENAVTAHYRSQKGKKPASEGLSMNSDERKVTEMWENRSDILDVDSGSDTCKDQTKEDSRTTRSHHTTFANRDTLQKKKSKVSLMHLISGREKRVQSMMPSEEPRPYIDVGQVSRAVKAIEQLL